MKTIPITVQLSQFENGDILLAIDRRRKECFILSLRDELVMTYTYSEMIDEYDFDPDFN